MDFRKYKNLMKAYESSDKVVNTVDITIDSNNDDHKYGIITAEGKLQCKIINDYIDNNKSIMNEVIDKIEVTNNKLKVILLDEITINRNGLIDFILFIKEQLQYSIVKSHFNAFIKEFSIIDEEMSNNVNIYKKRDEFEDKINNEFATEGYPIDVNLAIDIISVKAINKHGATIIINSIKDKLTKYNIEIVSEPEAIINKDEIFACDINHRY